MDLPHLTGRLRALSDPTRLVLLGVLLDEELTVGELAEICQINQSSVSRHLGALRDGMWVSARRQGAMTFYRACTEEPLFGDDLGRELQDIVKQADLGQRVQQALDRRRLRARSFFDESAAGWDELRAELLNETAVHAAMMCLLPHKLQIVDIGTGTGGMLPYLGPIASRLVGVDQSAAMLRRAKERARRLGLGHAEFVRADVSQLPLEDSSFDAAFASLVLHHVPKPLAAVREMARVLRPQAHAVIVDLHAHGQQWLRDEQADLWLGFSKHQLEEWLAQAGFESIVVRTVSKAPSPRGGGALELLVASAQKTVLG